MNLTEYIDSKREEHLNELCEFLRIPSVSAQSEHKPDIERAAKWVAEKLRAAGLDNVEILPTKMHPLVYGESLRAPGKPTILFYGHYDVQPAEPLNLWTSPAFEPTIRGGNLYGRGTADDKGQVHIHIRALDAIMKTAGKLPINLKVMIEGEEEVGSVSLWEFVNANKARLKADALVVSDTGMLARGVPSITYGLRGLNYYQIEITGPAQDLHSGIFGGAVPNPITILCELFAKLHDKNSRVAIPGFYDDVAKLSKAERKALNSLPWKASEFKQDRGRAGTQRGKRMFDRGATVDASDAGVERNLGRLHGRRVENGHPVQGVREIFDAPRAESECGQNHASGRAADPQAAAENGEVQARRAQPGKGVGCAVHAPVL